VLPLAVVQIEKDSYKCRIFGLPSEAHWFIWETPFLLGSGSVGCASIPAHGEMNTAAWQSPNLCTSGSASTRIYSVCVK
jgi:hypothetical protein